MYNQNNLGPFHLEPAESLYIEVKFIGNILGSIDLSTSLFSLFICLLFWYLLFVYLIGVSSLKENLLMTEDSFIFSWLKIIANWGF